MPTAFNVPLVYINSEVVTDSEELKSVAGMDDLLALCGGELKYKPMSVQNGLQSVYAEIFPEFSGFASKMGTVKEFVEEKPPCVSATLLSISKSEMLCRGSFL